MELTHLKSFLTVARKGNLSAAAKELNATQPNLGRQMAALAKEVGMELFVRHSRGVELTHRGKEFYELCQRIVGNLEQETANIREKDAEPQGSLKIVVGAAGLEHILEHLPDFVKKYPKLQYTFSSINDILTTGSFQFQTGNADAALAPITFSDPELVQHHLFDMLLRVYAAPSYFKKFPKPKTPKDLKSHHIIIYASENQKKSLPLVVPDLRDTSQDYSQAFMRVNNGIAMRSALLQGLGIGTFLYERNIVENKLLVDVFPDLPDHKVPCYFTYHKRLEGSPKILAFHQFLKEIKYIWERPRKKVK